MFGELCSQINIAISETGFLFISRVSV